MRSKTISRKIVVLTILIVSIVLIPIEIFNFLYEKTSAVDDLEHRALNLEKRISASISYPLWTYNDSEIQNVVTLEMANPFLAAVNFESK